MSDDLKVGRVVFSQSGDTTRVAGTNIPYPLEYAPKGPLEELRQARERIKELEGLVREMGLTMERFLRHDDLELLSSYINDDDAKEILNRPLVKEIMEKEEKP